MEKRQWIGEGWEVVIVIKTGNEEKKAPGPYLYTMGGEREGAGMWKAWTTLTNKGTEWETSVMVVGTPVAN